MKILIDMQSVQAGSAKGGIGRYSLNLLKSLVKNNKEYDFSILLNATLSMKYYEELLKIIPQERIYYFYAFEETQEKYKENKTRSKVSQLIRELVISLINPDMIFVTSLVEGYLDNVVVSLGKIFPYEKSAVILYDLIPLTQKEKYLSNPLAQEHYFEKIEQLKNAKKILAISEFSKKEGEQLLNIEDKIKNISSGVDEKFKKIKVSTEENNELKIKYELKENIILYVSSYDVRKNQKNLIEAFSKLPTNIKNTHQLILIGNGPKSILDDLKEYVKSLGLKDNNIKFLGFVPDEDLLKLYSISTLFVFPSLQEGFGLPALEAMCCEVPTIGSDSTSIVEVINLKEALFNPLDTDDISNKMNLALSDEFFRNKLISNAKTQSKEFSWDITANHVLKSFETFQKNKEITYFENFTNSYNKFIVSLKAIKELKNFTEEEFIFLSKLVEKNINSQKRKIGIISTWNTRCGIASYTRYLSKWFIDESVVLAPYTKEENKTQIDENNIVRTWSLSNDNLEKLFNTIIALQLEVILIQFNYGFFNFHSLNNFFDKLFNLGIKVNITFHSTTDITNNKDKKLEILKQRLLRCENIFIHTKKDEINLSKIGINKNVTLLKQGIIDTDETLILKKQNKKFILSTYGFFLESKGFINIIDAFKILVDKGFDIQLNMFNAKYNDIASNSLIEQAKEKINKYNLNDKIILNTEYLRDDETIKYLSQTDLVVYPYKKTGESSSAAVRMAIASRTNIAVTPQAIFDELKDFVYYFKSDSIEDIALGLEDIILNNNKHTVQKNSIIKKQEDFRQKNLYSKISKQLKNIILG
ncbi:glycosyltransferase [Campylobacterota bacterium DY0563]